MFNTFSAFLTSNTSGSNMPVALIKAKKTKLDWNIQLMDSNWDFDNNNNITQVATATSSAFCASLCDAFTDKLS